MSKVNKINSESTNMVLIYRAFNIEDLQRLRHQTAQVLPGQCVHYSQFVVQILYAASICCCLLNKLSERNLAEENNKMQLQNIVFIQNGAWECLCNSFTFQGCLSKLQPRLCGLSHTTTHTHTHTYNICVM